jgi:pimeloyl-ACP methyl ester carboxylesterase
LHDVRHGLTIGADDTIVTSRTVQRDYDNHGGPKTLVVLDGSHHLPFMDQPKALAREMRGFLIGLTE